MKSVILLGTIVFLYIFYDSFNYANEISPLLLTSLFYLFLLLCTFFIYTKKSKPDIFILLSAQTLLSLSLLSVGKYTFALILQFIFIPTYFKHKESTLKNVYLFLFFNMLNIALVLIFVSTHYLLYFANLLFLLYLTYKIKKMFLNTYMLIIGIIFSMIILKLDFLDEFLLIFIYGWILLM